MFFQDFVIMFDYLTRHQRRGIISSKWQSSSSSIASQRHQFFGYNFAMFDWIVKYVDEIREYSTESDLRDMLCEIWPDVRILGSDYITRDDFTGCEYNIPIYYHERNHDYSSSDLRKKIIGTKEKAWLI